MYHWFFLLEITVVNKMNNLNVCSPTDIYTHGSGLSASIISGYWAVVYICVRGIDLASVSTISRLRFRTVLVVWYFVFVLLLILDFHYISNPIVFNMYY
jgi:hypothetical protein